MPQPSAGLPYSATPGSVGFEVSVMTSNHITVSCNFANFHFSDSLQFCWYILFMFHVHSGYLIHCCPQRS